MGRKLDILLRRTFKASKLKTLLALAHSRVAVLQNQRQVRCSQTRNDVLQLLQLGQHERALLRVEHLIKDQNMLDVFVMIEGYCHLLTERVILVEQHKECPQELKEATASLIFAASRCGDFPELQEIRMVFTTRFGKEFAAAAVELRNSCGVNHKMIQKMSTKLPSVESRLKVVKEIAAEVGITVNIEEPPIDIAEVDSNLGQSQTLLDQTNSADMGGSTNSSVNVASEWDQEQRFSDSTKARKYTDVASAAQAAFESAAYAAAAARAAVELSRSESQDKGSDDQSSPSPRRRTVAERTRNDGSSRLRSEYTETPTRNTKNVGIEHFNGEKMHPVQNFSSESETEEVPLKQKDNGGDDVKGKYKENRGTFKSGSSSESIEFVSEEKKQQGKSIFFDDSEEESEKELNKISLERNDFFSEGKFSFQKEENKYYSPRSNKQSNHRGRTRELDTNSDSEVSDESKGTKLHYLSPRNTREVSRADSIDSFHEDLEKVGLKSRDEGNFVTSDPAEKYKLQTGHLNSKEKPSVQYSSVGRIPGSVRTRRNF